MHALLPNTQNRPTLILNGTEIPITHQHKFLLLEQPENPTSENLKPFTTRNLHYFYRKLIHRYANEPSFSLRKC